MNEFVKKKLKFRHNGQSLRIARRSCLSVVTTNHERILDMRAIGMTWNEISTYLGMSAASLHQAIKRLAKQNDYPYLHRARLMVYFDTENDKKEFKRAVRAIQREEDSHQTQ